MLCLPGPHIRISLELLDDAADIRVLYKHADEVTRHEVVGGQRFAGDTVEEVGICRQELPVALGQDVVAIDAKDVHKHQRRWEPPLPLRVRRVQLNSTRENEIAVRGEGGIDEDAVALLQFVQRDVKSAIADFRLGRGSYPDTLAHHFTAAFTAAARGDFRQNADVLP